MAVGIFPIFKPRRASIRFQTDGKILAAEFERLDDLADQLGVPRFSAFGDNRAIPEGFDGDPEALDELLGPFDDWFSPVDGLVTVDALLQAFDQPETAHRFRQLEDVRLELTEMRRSLEHAAAEGVQFRLEMA